MRYKEFTLTITGDFDTSTGEVKVADPADQVGTDDNTKWSPPLQQMLDALKTTITQPNVVSVDTADTSSANTNVDVAKAVAVNTDPALTGQVPPMSEDIIKVVESIKLCKNCGNLVIPTIMSEGKQKKLSGISSNWSKIAYSMSGVPKCKKGCCADC